MHDRVACGERRRFTYSLDIGTPSVIRRIPLLVSVFWRPDQGVQGAGIRTPQQSAPAADATEADGVPIETRCWTAPVLRLDLPFLARQAVPLLRVMDSATCPRRSSTWFRSVLYVVRILLHVHLWSFRLPDEAPDSSSTTLARTDSGLARAAHRRIDGRSDSEKQAGSYAPDSLSRQESGALAGTHDSRVQRKWHNVCAPLAEPSLAGYLWNTSGVDVWVLRFALECRHALGQPPMEFRRHGLHRHSLGHSLRLRKDRVRKNRRHRTLHGGCDVQHGGTRRQGPNRDAAKPECAEPYCLKRGRSWFFLGATSCGRTSCAGCAT